MIKIDYLNVEIDKKEIALIKGLKIDNPQYIPAMPNKGIAKIGEPYFERTQIVLKSGHEEILDISYKHFKEYYESR